MHLRLVAPSGVVDTCSREKKITRSLFTDKSSHFKEYIERPRKWLISVSRSGWICALKEGYFSLPVQVFKNACTLLQIPPHSGERGAENAT